MIRLLAALLLLAVASPAFADDKDKPKPNTLTPKEIADGWILLFDGESTFGWTVESRVKDKKPELTAKDGILTVDGIKLKLRTSTQFSEFELAGEYRVTGQASVCWHNYSGGQPGDEWHTELVPGVRDEWCQFSMKATRTGATYVINGKALPRPSFKISFPGNVRFGVLFSSTLGDDGRTHLELRNLKLRPLEQKPLFTGKNLDGWNINNADPKRMASKWEVTKEGELSVKNGPGDLVTEKEFDNFVLQFECKTLGKALNSGFFFRCIPGQYQNGYEAQIQNAFKDDDRTKPADFGTGAIYRRIAARKVVSNDNEWFTMTVVADGKHISTWVNGYQTVDWIDDRKENENPRQGFRAAKGPISIQGHDPTTDILFRNIRIAELPK